MRKPGGRRRRRSDRGDRCRSDPRNRRLGRRRHRHLRRQTDRVYRRRRDRSVARHSRGTRRWNRPAIAARRSTLSRISPSARPRRPVPRVRRRVRFDRLTPVPERTAALGRRERFECALDSRHVSIVDLHVQRRRSGHGIGRARRGDGSDESDPRANARPAVRYFRGGDRGLRNRRPPRHCDRERRTLRRRCRSPFLVCRPARPAGRRHARVVRLPKPYARPAAKSRNGIATPNAASRWRKSSAAFNRRS